MKTTKWDMAEILATKIACLEVALAKTDTKFLFETLGALARSQGMAQIARELGVTREGLYKSLSPDGHPSFETVIKLLDLLGMRITLEPKAAPAGPGNSRNKPSRPCKEARPAS